ncbi:hypothetical protein BJ742DRAFT_872918 [Cladochytrium replicatum]|nr:hypothetical protein BJ742DRAFT_872918 [Cladochytrium replicatum]
MTVRLSSPLQTEVDPTAASATPSLSATTPLTRKSSRIRRPSALVRAKESPADPLTIASTDRHPAAHHTPAPQRRRTPRPQSLQPFNNPDFIPPVPLCLPIPFIRFSTAENTENDRGLPDALVDNHGNGAESRSEVQEDVGSESRPEKRTDVEEERRDEKAELTSVDVSRTPTVDISQTRFEAALFSDDDDAETAVAIDHNGVPNHASALPTAPPSVSPNTDAPLVDDDLHAPSGSTSQKDVPSPHRERSTSHNPITPNIVDPDHRERSTSHNLTAHPPPNVAEGVQIQTEFPSFPYIPNLPKPVVTRLELEPVPNVVHPGVFTLPQAYLRWTEPNEAELADLVEYDMDQQDQAWLTSVNAERKASNLPEISEEVFEKVMDRLEKEWFDLTRNVAKAKKDDADGGVHEDAACAICDDGECENSNAIVFCDGCNLAVHQDCYGIPYIPEGQWLCRKCMLSPDKPVSCMFCPNEGGAFKLTVSNQWAHLLCALWIPEVSVANPVYMEPIDGINQIPRSRWKLQCYICKQKGGASIQCDNRSCFTAFHVSCARRGKLYMKMNVQGAGGGGGVAKGVGGGEVVMRAYCDKHCPKEHREKYDVDAAVLQVQREFEARERSASPRRHGNNRSSSVNSSAGGRSGSNSKAARAHQQHHHAATAPLIPSYIVERVFGDEMFSQHHRKGSSRISSGGGGGTSASGLTQGQVKQRRFLHAVCKYWSLKRAARRGAPLLKRLHLEPWTASASAYQEDELMRAQRFGALLDIREHLERVRMMVDQVHLREKAKLRKVRVQREVVELLLAPVTHAVRTVLEEIKSLDKQMLFAVPVTEDIAPDYFKTIKEPMDFATMTSKLNLWRYNSVDEFEYDVSLIWTNAMAYNEKSTVYYRQAQRFKQQSGACIQKARDRLAKLPVDPATRILPIRVPDYVFEYGGEPPKSRAEVRAEEEARAAAEAAVEAERVAAEKAAERAEARRSKKNKKGKRKGGGEVREGAALVVDGGVGGGVGEAEEDWAKTPVQLVGRKRGRPRKSEADGSKEGSVESVEVLETPAKDVEEVFEPDSRRRLRSSGKESGDGAIVEEAGEEEAPRRLRSGRFASARKEAVVEETPPDDKRPSKRRRVETHESETRTPSKPAPALAAATNDSPGTPKPARRKTEREQLLLMHKDNDESFDPTEVVGDVIPVSFRTRGGRVSRVGVEAAPAVHQVEETVVEADPPVEEGKAAASNGGVAKRADVVDVSELTGSAVFEDERRPKRGRRSSVGAGGGGESSSWTLQFHFYAKYYSFGVRKDFEHVMEEIGWGMLAEDSLEEEELENDEDDGEEIAGEVEVVEAAAAENSRKSKKRRRR